jgi:hypothetical protein
MVVLTADHTVVGELGDGEGQLAADPAGLFHPTSVTIHIERPHTGTSIETSPRPAPTMTLPIDENLPSPPAHAHS